MSQTTAPARKPLTYDQVDRILRTRKFVDHSHIGLELKSNLRIVGSGNATKDGKRVVYNTNAMRKDAVPAARAFLRDARTALSLGDQDALQVALQAALNEGVLTFSLDASWTQFPRDSSIIARVDSFTIGSGPDAGKTGIGLGSVRLVPGVDLKSDASVWDDEDAPESSVPAEQITAASQLG